MGTGTYQVCFFWGEGKKRVTKRRGRRRVLQEKTGVIYIGGHREEREKEPGKTTGHGNLDKIRKRPEVDAWAKRKKKRGAMTGDGTALQYLKGEIK